MATPGSSDGPPPQPHEPPPIIRISCRRCRGRKLKCDRATPRCSRCVKADEDCEYPGSRRTNVGKRTQVRELEAKLGQLENKIKIISAANEPETDDFPDIATTNFEPFLPTGTAFGSLPIHTHPAVQPTPPYDDRTSQTEISRLGLFEQLPAIELIEELVRIAQMLNLHQLDRKALQARSILAPARDWTETEERRPSEEAFKSGVEEKTRTLKSVLQETGERYSSFAGRILAAHLFHETMEHTEQPAAEGNPEDVKNGLYWKQHRDIDNSLATLLMALPETLRLPRNIRSANAVFVNVMTQAAIISLHRAAQWTMRPLRDILPEHTVRQSQNRLLPAAEEILHVFRMVPDIEATMQNAMLTFAAYMAALVFLEDFAAEHSQQSESSMDFLVGMLVTVGRNNAMVASLANQLAIDMHHLGIKSAVATKAFEFLAPKLAEKMADSPGVNFCLLHGPPRADDTTLAGITPQSSTTQTISSEKSGFEGLAGTSQIHDEDEMRWTNTIAESPPLGLRYPYEAMTW
ncbi:hypothetical protein BJF96_g8179 [Verticillium dahliae]|uniref:Zn(2)-C6 fungal-type domain-containing protein n=1 Tax=Verticillium dahliae TaxID=27337 RepID=A0AA45AIY5_VERDA|nr:hypothetical protein BJF96_g8179 [Verticillium dahliae]